MRPLKYITGQIVGNSRYFVRIISSLGRLPNDHAFISFDRFGGKQSLAAHFWDQPYLVWHHHTRSWFQPSAGLSGVNINCVKIGILENVPSLLIKSRAGSFPPTPFDGPMMKEIIINHDQRYIFLLQMQVAKILILTVLRSRLISCK